MSLFRDHEIEQRIRTALRGDSRIDQSEIDVRVECNTVYLSGEVDSAAEKRAATEDVEALLFGQRIVDDIRLKNYVERTNEELEHGVRQAIIRDLDAGHVPVFVEARDGVVVLSGRVDSYAQKSVVENIAWWTPGVTDVISRLQVGGISDPPDDLEY